MYRSTRSIHQSVFTGLAMLVILRVSAGQVAAPVSKSSEVMQIMSAVEFVHAYEHALATQDWTVVEPLIHPDASVTFSNGTVHKGRDAVRVAFERNFRAIDNENYRISNVHWLLQSENTAVFLFDFHWTGQIDGRDAAGAGRGTSVLVREDDGWKLLAEHLGPMDR